MEQMHNYSCGSIFCNIQCLEGKDPITAAFQLGE